MKTSNKVLFGGLATILFGAVIMCGITKANTKLWNKEACEKELRTSETLNVEFDKVEISQHVQATLEQGDFEVQIEGPENTMTHLKHDLEGGILRIYMDEGNYNPCPIKVLLRCPQLSGVQVSNGASVVNKNNFNTANMDIAAMNSGQVNLTLTSNNVSVSGKNSANITLKGNMTSLNVSGYNSAHIEAQYSKVNTAKVTLGNSSSATIHADTISAAKLVNSASLQYLGETVLGNVETGNSSSISRIKEN